MKKIFSLIIGGSLLFLTIEVFGEDRNMMKLYMTGNCAGCNFKEVFLGPADLSGADLSRAILFRADLSGADLSGANLKSANLTEADLSGANLKSANFHRANLFGANLSGADLSGAYLEKAILKKLNISGTKFCRTTLPWGLDNSGCAKTDDLTDIYKIKLKKN